MREIFALLAGICMLPGVLFYLGAIELFDQHTSFFEKIVIVLALVICLPLIPFSFIGYVIHKNLT